VRSRRDAAADRAHRRRQRWYLWGAVALAPPPLRTDPAPATFPAWRPMLSLDRVWTKPASLLASCACTARRCPCGERSPAAGRQACNGGKGCAIARRRKSMSRSRCRSSRRRVVLAAQHQQLHRLVARQRRSAAPRRRTTSSSARVPAERGRSPARSSPRARCRRSGSRSFPARSQGRSARAVARDALVRQPAPHHRDGCENAATLTTAALPAAAMPRAARHPRRPNADEADASGVDRRTLVSHRMACSTSSAKRGSDAKLSLSLAPWQRHRRTARRNRHRRRSRERQHHRRIAAQPCSTITLGQGNAVAVAGGISQPCSRRPFAVSIRTVSNGKP